MTARPNRVTRFAGRDPGPAARIAGFFGHLRANGLSLGVAETGLALEALTQVDAANPDHARRALKAVCAGCKDDADQFDALFDAFWMDAGRVKQRMAPSTGQKGNDAVHSNRHAPSDQRDTGGSGAMTAPDGGEGDAQSDGEGKLVAVKARNLARKDLRDLVRPEDVAEAEAVARQIGLALRDQRSRRRIASQKGRHLHFRRTIRRSLSTGGEPIRLFHRKRPDRTRNIVALCDVSGSMSVYAQVFLSFLGGLLRADPASDAYLFHTRLVRITEALRDKDVMRGIGRMSLMADGFGGGSKIGACLDRFSRSYARTHVNGRSVVMILSDGFDTGPAQELGDAVERIRRRGGRIIWLNPLKGWRDYEPIAAGMAAALPHVDVFSAANTLADLTALEPELVRL
ncbi:MAG: VWA domain-containing protein [Pseudomonadota bacterium]